MTPVKQKSATDCFRACLASILDLPLEAVPDFYAARQAAQKWLDEQHGLMLLPIIVPHVVRLADLVMLYYPDLHYIQIGMTRKGLIHAVIGRNGEIAFDPAPVPQGELYPAQESYHLELIGKKV